MWIYLKKKVDLKQILIIEEGINPAHAEIHYDVDKFSIYCNTSKANQSKMSKKLEDLLSEIKIEEITV